MPSRERIARKEERELHEHAAELTADIMATMTDEIEAMRRNLPARQKLYRAAQLRKWRDEHPERCKEHYKRYRETHRAQRNAYVRHKNSTDPEFHAKLMAKHQRWRVNRSEEDKEKERESNRRYYAEHREEILAKKREYERRYYAEHREEILAKKRAKAAEKRREKTNG